MHSYQIHTINFSLDFKSQPINLVIAEGCMST